MSKEFNTETDVRDDSETDDIIDSDDTVDEWTPPTKDEFDALLAKEKRSSSEAASRKRKLRELGYDPKTLEPVAKSDAGKDSDDDEKVSRSALREFEKASKFKANTLITEVPFALAEAGLQPEKLKRAMKFLDLDSVSVDSDGEIDGLLEQIDSLREDFPEFFKRTRMKDVASAKTVGTGNKTADSTKTAKTWEDQVRDMFNKGEI